MIEFKSNATRKETAKERELFANGACSNLPPGYALMSATEKAKAFADLAAVTPDDTSRRNTKSVLKGSMRAW